MKGEGEGGGGGGAKVPFCVNRHLGTHGKDARDVDIGNWRCFGTGGWIGLDWDRGTS